MYWWLCCTGVKKSHEIAHICCQTQGQHIQWKTISLRWLCIDLVLTPSEIMTSRETQELTTMNNVSNRISRANIVSVGKAVKRLTKILYSTSFSLSPLYPNSTIDLHSVFKALIWIFAATTNICTGGRFTVARAKDCASRPPRPPTRRNVTRWPWKSECTKKCVTTHLANQLHTQKSHNL